MRALPVFVLRPLQHATLKLVRVRFLFSYVRAVCLARSCAHLKMTEKTVG